MSDKRLFFGFVLASIVGTILLGLVTGWLWK